jgi:hypothetical protein
MIELKNDHLHFTFKDVHPNAGLHIRFQRTLRIPDDGSSYPLPPGLGSFPLRHVDDFAERVPQSWLQRGGVLMPMYQSEAMWIHFGTDRIPGGVEYPCAIIVGAGKINAVSGEHWNEVLTDDPQNYLVAPRQPWLDGYCVEKGLIRQFVAMPLGSGYSAEEQITGQAEHGGIQVLACPMKREVFDRRFPKPQIDRLSEYRGIPQTMELNAMAADMGLAPGGVMRQEIMEDPYAISDWDLDNASRCFVHIANSLVWRAITGLQPPTTPPTSEEYTNAGLPWFEYYDDSASPIDGSDVLAGLESVVDMGHAKSDVPVPENVTVSPTNVVEIRKSLAPDQVREGQF